MWIFGLLWHLKRGFATVVMEVREKVDVWWLLLHASSFMNSTVLLMDVFFFMGCLDQPHPKTPCLQMWSNLPDCCCRLQASSNSYFNIAERIMLLYVSLSSLGPFAMYCVGYLRCQCGEGGRNKACVCVRKREICREYQTEWRNSRGRQRPCDVKTISVLLRHDSWESLQELWCVIYLCI